MDFVTRETELAETELVPTAKHVDINSVLVAAAVTFLLHSSWILVIVLALALSQLMSLTDLNTAGCLTLGFLVAAPLSIGIAVLPIFMARGYLQKARAPTAIIEGARTTFVALTDAAIDQPTEVVMKEEPSPPEAS